MPMFWIYCVFWLWFWHRGTAASSKAIGPAVGPAKDFGQQLCSGPGVRLGHWLARSSLPGPLPSLSSTYPWRNWDETALFQTNTLQPNKTWEHHRMMQEAPRRWPFAKHMYLTSASWSTWSTFACAVSNYLPVTYEWKAIDCADEWAI